MNKLTKSDIERLKPLEPYFLQVKEKYKRASALSEDMLVSEYYKKLTGKKENNFACNQCVFKIYKTVGEAYWKALKETETKTTTDNKPKAVKKTKTNDRRRTKTKKE
jgi:hypothetical protein